MVQFSDYESVRLIVVGFVIKTGAKIIVKER